MAAGSVRPDGTLFRDKIWQKNLRLAGIQSRYPKDHCSRMKKIKYYYNTNTLRYEKLETPLRVTLLRVLGFLSAAIVTALILVSVAYKYFPSANEKRLMQRNEALKDNYYTLNEKVQKL